jgi:hypothetical protein
MPAYAANGDRTKCRYVLDDDKRSASTYLNYVTPSGVNKPAWMFDKLDILDAAKSTFYLTNGHMFGYAGFQVSTVNADETPTEGR